MISNLVFISDLHCGSKLGLCPPEFQLDEGTIVRHGFNQSMLWNKWLEFEEWVLKVTKGKAFALIINGDLVDGVHHGTTTIITGNHLDQRRIAIECLTPLVNKAEKVFIVRGTEVHSGLSGEDEEQIAKTLNAEKDDTGNHSRYELWLRFGVNKILVHASHHVGTTSSAGYESTAVYKELVEAYTEAGRWNNEPPDVIVRSHRHRYFLTAVPSYKGSAMAVVTPAWQLKTAYVHRGALGRSSTPQIGGVIIKESTDVPVYERHFVYSLPRPKEEVI